MLNNIVLVVISCIFLHFFTFFSIFSITKILDYKIINRHHPPVRHVLENMIMIITITITILISFGFNTFVKTGSNATFYHPSLHIMDPHHTFESY